MKKAITRVTGATLALVVVACGAAFAQRTQSVGDQSKTTTDSRGRTVITPTPAPAPATVKAKYEGGVIGYGKTDGTLNFDDANSRLLFRDKQNKEVFSVPYDVVMAAYADTTARRSTAATVAASTIPYGLGLPALLLPKNKKRYLIVNYSDPDTKAQGMTSFKIENKEMLTSVLYTLGQKAGLTQRGDAFVRRRDLPPGETIAVPVLVPGRSRP